MYVGIGGKNNMVHRKKTSCSCGSRCDPKECPKKGLLTLAYQDRQNFVDDIESLFRAAVEKGQYATALKARELLAREKGLLSKKEKVVTRFINPALDKLSDDNLAAFLSFLLEKEHGWEDDNEKIIKQ